MVYAIGDIHGRDDCLKAAHELIDRDAAGRDASACLEVYIGDYIDRGPNSRQVVDRLLERDSHRRLFLLRGNHENILASFLRGQVSFEAWRAIGGLETVLSYGVDARDLLSQAKGLQPEDLAKLLPPAHVDFLQGLGDSLEIGAYQFVHAGVRPGVALENQSIYDLTSIREEFLKHAGDFGGIVVHGHTPAAEAEFLPNRINIDTGAYITNRLSVLRIDATGVSIAQARPS